ncbi:unnamed protein product [Pseudo-nitzschia multistriata]|uniref:Thioredoxin-like fold domain-containing protein n=1 Tax=Pseudo-nitzschia multistriata TaxID=183589 RepID=A0A448ZPM9_9STRA|nr:unnamed protein product [Pseudo-nitzschia multistriata]
MAYRSFLRLAIFCVASLHFHQYCVTRAEDPLQQRQQRQQQQQEEEEEERHASQHSPSDAATAAKITKFHNRKIKVDLYYMPQCPGCRQLITSSFNEAFHTPGFSNMADVTFIPYSDGRIDTGSDSSTKRIFSHTLESCALHFIGIGGADGFETNGTNGLTMHKKHEHQELQFRYIDCIDHYPSYQHSAATVDVECAKAIGLSEATVTRIESCASSQEGHRLAERYVKQVHSITNPRITYFPWTMVDNVHDKDTEERIWNSLFEHVCSIYSGPLRSLHCQAPGDMNGTDDEDDYVYGKDDDEDEEEL